MDRSQELAPEVVALLHRVELNQGGWWHDTMDRLVQAVLAGNPAGMTAKTVTAKITNLYETRFDALFVQERLDALRKAGKVVREADVYALAERTLTAVQKQQNSMADLAERVKDRFIGALTEAGCMLNPTTVWEDFQTTMVGPLIKQLGARTYNLVRGRESLPEDARPFDEFLTGIEEREQSAIKAAVERFFDPSDADVRTWLLSRLHAYFLILAARIDQDTLRALSVAGGEKLQFIVVLDTNFLFSLLGLHSNPSDEAAQLLVELISEISDVVDVELCVLPPTVQEAVEALRYAKQNAPGEVWPNMAEGARQHMQLGLVSRFVQRVGEAQVPITRDRYFDPLIDNFDYVLRDHGVTVIDDPLVEQLLQNGQLSSDVSRLVTDTGKGPNTVRHDLVLWRYVNDKRRPSNSLRPSETKYWGVTVDYAGLLRYDRDRRRALQGLPRVMHPTQFIQMLQFWVPRTERMEKALFGSARLPLLFPEFDEQTEQATLRILAGMAHYKNVSQMSTQSVIRMLQDNALRAEVFGDVSNETVVSAVESSAFRLAAELEADQERAEQVAEKLREENRRLLEERTTKDARTQGAVQTKKRLLEQITRQDTESRKQQNRLQAQNKDLRAKLAQRDGELVKARQAREHERALWRFGLVWGLLTLVVAGACVATWFLWLDTRGGTPWRLAVLALTWVSLSVALGTVAARLLAKGHPAPFFGALARTNKFLVVLIGGAFVGAVVQFAIAPPS